MRFWLAKDDLGMNLKEMLRKMSMNSVEKTSLKIMDQRHCRSIIRATSFRNLLTLYGSS